MKNIIKSILLSGIFFLTSCEKDLEVLNENEPDFLSVYSNGEDVYNITANLYNSFYFPNEFRMKYLMATSADSFTSSLSWFGWNDVSVEPRTAWNNSPSYSEEFGTSYTFNRMYNVINTATLVIKALDNGLEIGSSGADTDLVRAFARFNMGITYGTLALTFDKSFIVDENTTLSDDASVEDAKTYKEVAAQAIVYLDEAISILSVNSYDIPANWMGSEGNMTSNMLLQYANSWAARLLSSMPRNSTELASVDWTAVKQYADAGITSDFSVFLDGWGRWTNYGGYFMTASALTATDMYVVNKLDPTMPAHWGDDLVHPPASTNPNADKRIETDFAYRVSNNFPADRGKYHWSNYRWKRLDELFLTARGPMPEFMLAENDMYKAEALAYTGNLSGAAAIINAGTRTTRGELPPVAANLTDIIEAIHHERVIEMMLTGTGLQFYEMRKRNLLQKGTPLHWPLPAKTMETFGEAQPFYTFGGPNGQDGINGSSGGWR